MLRTGIKYGFWDRELFDVERVLPGYVDGYGRQPQFSKSHLPQAYRNTSPI